ncbi:UNKNOWN [Stylonychia lemnae]|uniref:Uncharacterized protein n=1 Tax=Stylonychia lemnae TaxID=5949 RepID=A0A078AKZ9_STYLE|nr:UNKNOWN [Stylonychia lemnae]|eukprot:CDW81513.1 UNKNOWN [Stylonychia lemnae]
MQSLKFPTQAQPQSNFDYKNYPKTERQLFQGQNVTTLSNIKSIYEDQSQQQHHNDSLKFQGKTQRQPMMDFTTEELWKMKITSGFNMHKKFRQRGKQIIQEYIKEREEEIIKLREKQVKSVIEDKDNEKSVLDYPVQDLEIPKDLQSTSVYLEKIRNQVSSKLEQDSYNKQRNIPNSHTRQGSMALPNILDRDNQVNSVYNLQPRKKTKHSRNNSNIENNGYQQASLASNKNKLSMNESKYTFRDQSQTDNYQSSTMKLNKDTQIISDLKMFDESYVSPKVTDTIYQKFVRKDQKNRKHRNDGYKVDESLDEKNSLNGGSPRLRQSIELGQNVNVNTISKKEELRRIKALQQSNQYPDFSIYQEAEVQAIRDREEKEYIRELQVKIYENIQKDSQNPNSFENMIAEDLSLGLKVGGIAKLVGGPFDKQKLNVSKIDMGQAFSSDNMKKENFADNGEEDELAREHYARIMRQNDYFIKFAQKHQQKLEGTIEKIYAKDPERQDKYVPPVEFKTSLLKFIRDHNHYRQVNPDLFEYKNSMNKDFVKDQLNFLKPIKVHQNKDYEQIIENQEDIRRLKVANYGRWYIKPDEYNKKIVKLNKRIEVYNQGKSISQTRQ